jgi:glutathione peroxidase
MKQRGFLNNILNFLAFSMVATPQNIFAQEAKTYKSLYEIEVTDIDGQKRNLSEFKGKVALVVNTASKCGFTPQYDGLEILYNKYKDKGFVVLGFPSNDFLRQEPGSDADIKNFCQTKYSVTFPMFSKAPVSGRNKQPVYTFLTEQGPENLRANVKWNFEKMLVDQEGQLVMRWRSFTAPQNQDISEQIELLLAKNVNTAESKESPAK